MHNTDRDMGANGGCRRKAENLDPFKIVWVHGSALIWTAPRGLPPKCYSGCVMSQEKADADGVKRALGSSRPESLAVQPSAFPFVTALEDFSFCRPQPALHATARIR